MKKLRLYDHLGQLVKEFDVYVEGQSFTWRSPKPEAIWLGTVALQDVDEDAEIAHQVAIELEPEPEVEVKEEGGLSEEAKEMAERMIKEKVREEVESEPEKPDDKSLGDTRTGETEQLESREVTPEADTTPSVAKGSKGYRKPKSVKGAVGSRARKRATGSGRGKAKGTAIGGSDEKKC